MSLAAPTEKLLSCAGDQTREGGARKVAACRGGVNMGLEVWHPLAIVGMDVVWCRIVV